MINMIEKDVEEKDLYYFLIISPNHINHGSLSYNFATIKSESPSK